MFAILAVRQSTKEVTSRGVCGDLQKNCPGSLSVVPYTTSADEHLMPSFIAVCSPRCTRINFPTNLISLTLLSRLTSDYGRIFPPSH